MQYNNTTHEIVWPDKRGHDIFEAGGSTAYINPTTSATS